MDDNDGVEFDPTKGTRTIGELIAINSGNTPYNFIMVKVEGRMVIARQKARQLVYQAGTGEVDMCPLIAETVSTVQGIPAEHDMTNENLVSRTLITFTPIEIAASIEEARQQAADGLRSRRN